MPLTKAQLMHKRIHKAVLEGKQIFQHSDDKLTIEITVRRTDFDQLRFNQQRNLARHKKKDTPCG